MENGPLNTAFFLNHLVTIQHDDFTMKNWELSNNNWLQGGATKRQLGWFTTMLIKANWATEGLCSSLN